MIPTNELRFVGRDVFVRHDLNDDVYKTIPVLQQKWIHVLLDELDNKMIRYEWRDVPLVKEGA